MYSVTLTTVQTIAQQAAQGIAAAATYLQVLVTCTQEQLKKVRRRPRTTADALVNAADALEAVHKWAYPAVLAGVGSSGRDQHRRSAFARSAASTLRSFIQAGGDVRTLDATTVTKGLLRRAVAPPEPSNKVLRQVVRGETGLTRALQRLAKTDPAAAISHMQRMSEVFADMARAFEDKQQRPPEIVRTQLTRTRRRVPTPQPEARA